MSGFVLVIDDDPDVRFGCEQALQIEHIATVGAATAEDGLAQVRSSLPSLVVTDVRLPGRDGLAVLDEIQTIDPELPVVLITGHGDVALAVKAMKAGAYDFIEKPFQPEFLVDVVRRGLEKRALTLEIRDLKHQLRDRDRLEARILGQSASIVRLRQLIQDIADTNASVLINGETGTGKELIARCLHEASPRRKGHFVAVNCGGLPESLVESEIFGHEAGAFTGAAKRRIGKIEYANGGTLFLDEIESMPVSVQIKLLRVLQERTLERLGSNTQIDINCRVIAATKADLGVLSAAGRFRADLYYRLNVASLLLPPLRDRREDIPRLFAHFVEQLAIAHGRPVPVVPPAKMQRLVAYGWPGNVRELRNVADRLVLGIEMGFPPFAEVREEEALPLPEAVDAFERAMIVEAMSRCDHNLTLTAQALRIPKTTLFDKLKKHSLKST
ncbi:MAG: sigma-54 dependent transcriptional regulator [Ancalomicrobiaceae bacterium]|nr:sigma-54 dependent transcriptional regulator [Ancalomicrobiaceae bacterium]